VTIERQSVRDCPAHTDEAITAEIARAVKDNWFEMVACLAKPNLAVTQAQVLAMVHSIHNAG
jgi:hypothetical protein